MTSGQGTVLYDIDGDPLSVEAGTAIPAATSALVSAGSDGTNARFIRVTSDGYQLIVGTGVAGTPAGGVITIQGDAAGTPIPISGNITASNASVDDNDQAIPAFSTLIGGSDGTNLRPLRVFDADSGGGQQWVLGVSLRKTAGGGSVDLGTSTDPIRIDPTGTTTQPVSGTVTANQGGSWTVAATQSGTWTVQPGNTANTTPWLMTINQGGNSATVTASNALKVDGSAVTQPVSGTVTANAGTGNFTVVQATASNLRAQLSSETTTGTAIPSTAVMVGGSDGTLLRSLFVDSSGRQIVVGAAASGAAVAGNPVLMAGSDGTNARSIAVDTSGRQIVAPFSIVSTANSTTATLGSGGIFTGTFEEVKDYAVIVVSLRTDQASAASGLEIQWSTDGSNIDDTDNFTIPANDGKFFTFGPETRYFRIKYTNGGVAQGAFRLQVIYHYVNMKPSSHRIGDTITDENDAELVKSVLTAKASNGSFVNINATNSGNLKVGLDSTFLEDDLHTTGDSGNFILGVRNDAAASLTSTNGDYSAFATDSAGRIGIADLGGSITVDTTQLPGSLVGGRLDTNVGAWLGSTAPTVGQKTMANSLPIAIASDQTAVPVSQSGTWTVQQGTPPWSVVGPGASGAAVSGNPVRIAGSDGTNTRDILTDTSGRQVMVGAAADGAAVTGNPVLIAGQDGTNAQSIATDGYGRVQVSITGASTTQIEGRTADGYTLVGNPVPMAGVDDDGYVQSLLTDGYGKLQVVVTETSGTPVTQRITRNIATNTTIYNDYTVPGGSTLTVSSYYVGGTGVCRSTLAKHDSSAVTFISNGDFENAGQITPWAAVTGSFSGGTPDSNSTQFQTGAASMRWTYSNSATALARRQTFTPVQDFSGYRYIRVKFFHDAPAATTRTISVVLASGTPTRTYSLSGTAGTSPFTNNTWVTLTCELDNPTSSTGAGFDLTAISTITLSMQDAANRSGTVYWDTLRLEDQLDIRHRIYSSTGDTVSAPLNPTETFNSGEAVYLILRNSGNTTQEFTGIWAGTLI